jgi:hypothetical protein
LKLAPGKNARLYLKDIAKKQKKKKTKKQAGWGPSGRTPAWQV